MKIAVTRQGIRKNEVYFTADCGEGKGIWCGSTPILYGEAQEVEFELPALLMRWVDIIPAAAGGNAVRMDGEQVLLTGILENIEEDGTGYLRLGEELIMFECLGEPMALGGCVEIRTRELMIYPVNL
ncbi:MULTISPECIES: hypothetical protein [unclassified Paenibacillus]|uniref:hypothetical protein n=1 Tax=unclassified Paenibacillus TaxID=185978 RepID=UPI0024069D78|nr:MULTISPECIES: hypothetical protein [unclassified Paenibacillus]MDF9843361.1 hypothetical protein [Paenibacillus sp. PastF-2]MDF9849949.1 hypothetical protein [Paenibacillus sp. PastM-2]MDF9856657.1 hypothetical protein [Paenibacillus sp. PastF-1]MDH6481926.1 hypothetical protein [Paenibacillus sp. PastH-2]MDH6509352.1 hypothetical protein [Paenibacillus sp. PastM-3]